MLRQGPIPVFVHGSLEYVVGLFLIAAPFLLSFDAGLATAASMVLGIALLVLAAITRGPTSLVDQVPRAIHVAADVVIVGCLLVAPFVLDFRDEATPRNIFIFLGVVHLLVTIGTRFVPEPAKERQD
jgi:hypothetical protein